MAPETREPANGCGEGPSADKVRDGIVERLRAISSRNALLGIDAVVSLLEPPYDEELCVEAFLGVAEIIAGQRLLARAGAMKAGEEGNDEPS